MRFVKTTCGLLAVSVLLLGGAPTAYADIPPEVENKIRKAYTNSIYEIQAVHPNLPPGEARGPKTTGFLISRSGHIMTARHLVKDFTVPLEDIRYLARLPDSDQPYRLSFFWASSEQDDILVLKTSHPHLANQTPLQLARIGRPRAIDAFVLGLDSAGEIDGTVVRFAKTDSKRPNLWVINTDLNPGRSGSPVFDKGGRVIGLMHANTGKDRSSFAPIQHVQSDLEDRGIIVLPEADALPDWQRYLLIGLAVLSPLLMILGYVLSRRNRA